MYSLACSSPSFRVSFRFTLFLSFSLSLCHSLTLSIALSLSQFFSFSFLNASTGVRFKLNPDIRRFLSSTVPSCRLPMLLVSVGFANFVTGVRQKKKRKFLMGMYLLHSRGKIRRKRKRNGKREMRGGRGFEKVPERELEKRLGKSIRGRNVGSGVVIFASAAAEKVPTSKHHWCDRLRMEVAFLGGICNSRR